MTDRDTTTHNILALDSGCKNEELASVAIALATSDDPAGLGALRDHLRSEEFLRRLDDVDNPSRRVYYLSRVFSALETRPSPGSLDLCVAVAESAEFNSLPVRMNYLLPALGAVRPLTESAAAIFRRTNPEGFFSVNGPILVRNGSPLALRLFEEMIRAADVESDARVDVVHESVLPYRTELPVLETSARLIDSQLEPEVRTGVIETVFDYQVKRWFGAVRVAPAPRPWDTATDEALEFALGLSDRVLARADVPAETRGAVERSASEIRSILERRRQ
jgi:hypothetical protein